MRSTIRIIILSSILVAVASFGLLRACKSNVRQIHITLDPMSVTSEFPPTPLSAGQHNLELGATLFINKGFQWRDGAVYVPSSYDPEQKYPLLIWMHGGGGHARYFFEHFPIVEKLNLIVVAIDSRHNTWDGIDSPFGPDVEFIEKTLNFLVSRLSIDTNMIALGGVSDGGSYALAVGRVNGDLFSHIIAVAPGYLRPPAPTNGSPKIYVGHGIHDNVYPIGGTQRWILPELRKLGYDVTFESFDTGHAVSVEVANNMMQWFVDDAERKKQQKAQQP